MKKTPSSRAVLAASVAAVTFIVFLPALRNGFVEWDDSLYVLNNPYIRTFDLSFFSWAFTTFHAANWHPLTWVSHALDYALWGLNPLGHHLANNILHALNSFLVVLLVARLVETVLAGEKSIAPSAYKRFTLVTAGVTGLLFGIHPIHVESVAWVAERKDVLCAFFFLLSMMNYISYRSRKTYETYILSLLFFALALFSKPMAVSLPVVLLILDWYPYRRISDLKTFLSALVEKAPFLAFSLASSIITIQAQGAGNALVSLQEKPWPARTLLAAHSLVAYLAKTVLPTRLLPYYPYPGNVSLLSVEYALSAALVICLTAAAFFATRKHHKWTALWFYYVITLIPVIGIVQVGEQAMADRYMYLPSLGPFLIAGLGAAWVSCRSYGAAALQPLSRIAPAAIAVVLIVVLGSMTVRQTRIWKDGFTLWSSVIASRERVPLAYNNRGLALARLGQYDSAIKDFSDSISLDPRCAECFNNRGLTYHKMGLSGRAIEDFSRALAMDADYATAYCNRGRTYSLVGRYDLAMHDFSKAIHLKKDYAAAYRDRGYLYLRIGDRTAAGADFRTACAFGNEEGCRARQMYAP